MSMLRNCRNLKGIYEIIRVPSKIESETYVKGKLIKEGYEVKRGRGVGCPDFVIKKDNRIAYVEVKSIYDSLTHTQIQWILKHPKEKVYIYHIIQVTTQMEIARKFNEKLSKKVAIEFAQEKRKRIIDKYDLLDDQYED